MIGAAFDAMDALTLSNTPKACTLYGGEPLLQQNRPVILEVIREAARHGYRLMAASNGFDLAHYTDVLRPDGIAGLHVVLDGPASTHSTLRIGMHRAPTFDAILENIRYALARGVRIRLRVNADRAKSPA